MSGFAAELRSRIDRECAYARNGEWDYEGDPVEVNSGALAHAGNLIRELDLLGLPVPEVTVTPRGNLCFDLVETTKFQLAIVLMEGEIGFALYSDGESTHGSFPWDSGELPGQIRQAIKDWLDRNGTGGG